VMTLTLGYMTFVPAFVLAGLGADLVFALSASAVLANMRDEDHAKALGTNSTAREIGVALGIAGLTVVRARAGSGFAPTGYTDAAGTAVWTGAGVLLLATLIATLLPAGKSGSESVAKSEFHEIASAKDRELVFGPRR